MGENRQNADIWGQSLNVGGWFRSILRPILNRIILVLPIIVYTLAKLSLYCLTLSCKCTLLPTNKLLEMHSTGNEGNEGR